jgi:hypothetical protein
MRVSRRSPAAPRHSFGVARKVNAAQLSLLRWIAGRNPRTQATNSQRVSARALSARRLVTIKGRGPRWSATLTNAGMYYLEHGDYPPDHFGPSPKQPEAEPLASVSERVEGRLDADPQADLGRSARHDVPPKPAVDLTVDSPAGKRRRGHRPAGDALFSSERQDPYDEKLLVTVKEAAWMLSLPEHAIRQAVSAGDLDRVFIGDGARNYRVVYGSLLAWVNSMPRESAHTRWWR